MSPAMAKLDIGQRSAPWFGPRVFDDAAACPAKASNALAGWQLPPGVGSVPMNKTLGPWGAAADLLKVFARHGPTSGWADGTHPVTDLRAFAATTISHSGQPVQEFAALAVEALLDAQSAHGTGFNYVDTFIKVPFGSGSLHAGGTFLFAGPHDQFQLWRLRTGPARPVHEDTTSWATLAAYALTEHRGEGGHPPPALIEAFEVGATGGGTTILGSFDPDTLASAYAALYQNRLLPMVRDRTISPGPHCASCTFVGRCPAAPTVTGLLQTVPRQPALVKVTASDLRRHAECPHRYRLYNVDGLPPQDTTGSQAMWRGTLVDRWLTHNHRRGTQCTAADAQRLLDDESDPAAAAMAINHVSLCPLADPDSQDFLPQPYFTALDAESRVLLVARPDATYTRDGATVWRETKTRTTNTVADATTLVDTDLSAALYLTVLASGAAGTPDALEWEVLTANSKELTILPCDDHNLLNIARTRVSAAVYDALTDPAYPPRVGARCTECPVRQWCAHMP
jgi:hypothetical protein